MRSHVIRLMAFLLYFWHFMANRSWSVLAVYSGCCTLLLLLYVVRDFWSFWTHYMRKLIALRIAVSSRLVDTSSVSLYLVPLGLCTDYRIAKGSCRLAQALHCNLRCRQPALCLAGLSVYDTANKAFFLKSSVIHSAYTSKVPNRCSALYRVAQ